MNHEYKTSSKFARSCIAVLATVSTVLVLAGIAGLADHYGDNRVVMAAYVAADRS